MPKATTSMTREQIENQLRDARGGSARRLKMRASDLAHFDFSGLDLTGADLSFSNLNGANFEGTKLQGANLSFSNLSDANFTDADLRDANLNFCGLDGVTLERAHIEGISMSFSSLGRYAKKGQQAIPAESLTLTALMQHPMWSLIIGAILGVLLMYGCSGVVYFSTQIALAKDPVIANLNHYILLQNIVGGVAVALATIGNTHWLDNIRLAWLRYVLISVLAIVVYLGTNLIQNYVLGQDIMATVIHKYTKSPFEESPWYFYLVGPVLVANLTLYLIGQGRQLTRKLSEQEFQLLNMEKLKTRAELDALQAKINPHFLYNALNSIASLVHDDPDKAETMTLLLSKLFRYSTGRDGAHVMSLAEELDMVQTYLQVEQVRFGDRLQVSVSVDGNEVAHDRLLNLSVPQFLLQPIVENAVKHGISKLAGAGRIDVIITEVSGWLKLCVHDNGPDFSDTLSGGYGLRSIQDKLRLLYGDDAKLTLENKPQKQVCIQIKTVRLTGAK